MHDDPRPHPFRDSTQDVAATRRIPDTPQTRAPAYRLAFADPDFMTREELCLIVVFPFTARVNFCSEVLAICFPFLSVTKQ